MSNITITGLSAIGTITSATLLPVVDVSGTPTTKKATVAQLISGLPVATSSAVGTMPAADKAKLDAATDANTASAIVRRDASGNFTAGTVTAATVTGLSTPTNPTDAANKSYVDASAAGLTVKQAARVATIANVTLSGGAPNVVDGITLLANDRICVKNQSTLTQNGIYYVATLGTGSNGTWTRTTDADTGAELATGTYVFVTAGAVNANAAFTMVTQGTIVIGTSDIVWALFSQVTSIDASSIAGKIIQSQIQDGAINTAKFAAGLTPVEVLGTLPSSGNFAGRQVFLTTDSKLYRYTGSAFTVAVPTVDLIGQVTTTQITDNAITSAKVLAGAVTAGKIAANAVTAGTIDANAVTAGTIQAGAVNTTELAANAVNASKIAAGAVTASKITVADLASINANIGAITSGSLTSVDLTASSGLSQVSISTAGLVIGSGRITLAASGSNPTMRVYAVGGTDRIEINGNSTGGIPATIVAYDGSANPSFTLSSAGLFMTNAKSVNFGAGSRLQKTSSDSWTPKMFDGGHDLEFQWDGADLKVRIDGSTVKTIVTA